MREIRIGYVRETPDRPWALGATPYCRYLPVRDWNRLLSRAGRLLNGVAPRPLLEVAHLAQQFRGQRLQTCIDLLHLHNQIGQGRHPWVASFEQLLPQPAPGVRCAESPGRLTAHPDTTRALAALAADPCRKLLALSRAAAERQHRLLAACPEQRWEACISPKIAVLPPAQPRLLATVNAKPPLAGRPLRVLCIAASSLLEEGAATWVTVAAAVRSRHPRSLELTLVGPLGAAEAQSARAAQALTALLQRHRDWVAHQVDPDRRTLLSWMRSADLAVLTPRSDAALRQLLELQACGCPVISSDVGALGEYNPETCGWLIRVPREYQDRPASAATGAWTEALQEGLTRCLADIVEHPLRVRRCAEQALQRIDLAHDPALIGERLFEVYLDGLTRRRARTLRAPSVSW